MTSRSRTSQFGKTLYQISEDADSKVVKRVAEIAAVRGVPRAQIALAWGVEQA